MKRGLIYIFILMVFSLQAAAMEVLHNLETTIGVFDACTETFSYKFTDNNYDIKTSVKTAGAFGALYPFFAQYHSFGTYDKNGFKPQKYVQSSQSRFHKRAKEIVYQDGVPQYRISQKDKKRRQDDIEIKEPDKANNDLLSTFAELSRIIIDENKCDYEQYSFNGKRYSLSKVETVGSENLQTPYFEGEALKCQYILEVLDDADAGFFLNKDVPVYFWVLKDKTTNMPFIARILVESTPFGQLESLTTKIEVKK